MRENWKCLLTTKHRSYSLLGSGTRLGRTCHPPHTSAVHSTSYGNRNSKYPIDRSRSNDITIVHTTSAQAGIDYDHGTRRYYELYKTQSPPQPRVKSLTDCDDNSATHVLAAAVYCQLEKNYFDEIRSRSDVAALFRCNTSQLSKAITGVEYKSGPHHYKLKKVSKREAESSTQDPTKQKEPHTADADPKDAVLPEDTLSSSSGDSSLPPGLF